MQNSLVTGAEARVSGTARNSPRFPVDWKSAENEGLELLSTCDIERPTRQGRQALHSNGGADEIRTRDLRRDRPAF